MPSVVEHVATDFISQKIHSVARSFRHLSCVAASHILYFALYQHHHEMGQQEEPVVDICSPRRQFRSAMHEPVW